MTQTVAVLAAALVLQRHLARSPGHASGPGSLAPAVRALLARRRQRRQLADLAERPDRLADLGLSRADALREASRPWWRA